MESTQEQTRIKQAQSGDQKALALLFHHYYPFLFKYALKLTWSRETAEDFVQETMLKAMTHLSSYNGTSRFSSWLVTIGTRQYFDQIRKCKREKKWIEEEKKHALRKLQWNFGTHNIEWSETMGIFHKIPDSTRIQFC